MDTATHEDVWDLLEQQLKRDIKLNWNPGRPVVLAIDSEKGGVGKSGLAGGLIAVMAANGHRVLGIDLDPRATLTEELGLRQPDEAQADEADEADEGEESDDGDAESAADDSAPLVTYSVNDLLYVDPNTPARDRPALKGLAQEALLPAGSAWGPNVSVLAAERALAHREFDPSTNLEQRLRVSLEGVVEQFDLVVIDMPPRAGGKLVGSGILAATHVIFPGTLDRDGFVGVQDARNTLSVIRETESREIVDCGVLRNIVDRKTEIGKVFDRQFEEELGEHLLPVAVPRRVIRVESRTACMPITVSNSQGARDVINGYTAVLNHIGRAA